MKKLQLILLEALRVLGACSFWSAALLAAIILFPVALLWSEMAALRVRGITGAATFRTSPIAV